MPNEEENEKFKSLLQNISHEFCGEIAYALYAEAEEGRKWVNEVIDVLERKNKAQEKPKTNG